MYKREEGTGAWARVERDVAPNVRTLVATYEVRNVMARGL